MKKDLDMMEYMPNELNPDNHNLSDLASRAAVQEISGMNIILLDLKVMLLNI